MRCTGLFVTESFYWWFWISPENYLRHAAAGLVSFFLWFADETKDTLQGLFIDLLETLLTEELGWSVAQRLSPWRRAQNEVEDGVADIMITIPTPPVEVCQPTAVSANVVLQSRLVTAL